MLTAASFNSPKDHGYPSVGGSVQLNPADVIFAKAIVSFARKNVFWPSSSKRSSCSCSVDGVELGACLNYPLLNQSKDCKISMRSHGGGANK